MTDEELDAESVRELASLGLDKRNYKAVCLLPLVEIAWADGVVQPGERTAILKAARLAKRTRPRASSMTVPWRCALRTVRMFSWLSRNCRSRFPLCKAISIVVCRSRGSIGLTM